MYWGSRNCGWLGSFQIDQIWTLVPKWRPIAVMNCWNCWGSGRVVWSLPPAVAHWGTGPDTVRSTGQPRFWAPSMNASNSPQL